MNIRGPLTVVALIGVLVFGLTIGWQLVTEDVPSLRESTGTAEPSCHYEELDAGSKLRAGQVTVNVFNAGQVSNLAGKTMRALSRRGFEGGVTGNAPKGMEARYVLILYPDPKSPQVRLVARQFRGQVRVKKSDEDSAAIVIIVGNNFAPLSDFIPGAPTSMKIKGTTDVCVPVTPDAN